MARIGPDMFYVETEVCIGYPAGGEAHDLRNTGSSHMICIIDGQRLGFDVVDYPEQDKLCIGMPASWRILLILPLSATRDYLLTRPIDL